ncbi:hypothetical protein PMV44_01735 [Enterococcus casseliflavus]|uniref:hypothetical protein n=1 Tax=Enterococcus TaxID=1350 RepID=UPI00232A7A79|nr:hypothetical protein [Enterococcus casseliflavus]MDB1690567.1 hypothetical protein [Enterococcus casseliflavus]
MQEYILNKNLDNHRLHEIHTITCNEKPLPENRENLGAHENCASAISAARRNHPEWIIDGCKYCCPDCHTDSIRIPHGYPRESKY